MVVVVNLVVVFLYFLENAVDVMEEVCPAVVVDVDDVVVVTDGATEQC